MAKKPLNNAGDNWDARLNANVSAITTSFILKANGATGSPDTDSLAVIDSEIVQVTNVAVDTPSGGLDTLTVVRGYDGSAPSTHSANATIACLSVAAYNNELKVELDNIRSLFLFIHGDNGVFRIAAGTSLKTQETSPSPTMGVIVGAGGAMVDGQPVGKPSQFASALLVPPSVNPRIDTVQIDQAGNIEILTGSEAGSPTAPSVEADALLLAWITHTVAETIIEDADGGEGYITDKRAFL